jgi:hypothetical protein
MNYDSKHEEQQEQDGRRGFFMEFMKGRDDFHILLEIQGFSLVMKHNRAVNKGGSP